MTMISLVVLGLLLLVSSNSNRVASFSIGSHTRKSSSKVLVVVFAAADADNADAYDLKEELTKYLQAREEVNADEVAKSEVGRVVGGTKGNAILDFVSGAPNKEIIIEDAPDTFDYSELRKYGFGYLVEPIMEAGGRLEMYQLMSMEVPANKIKMRQFGPGMTLRKDGNPLEEGGYQGLGMKTLIDDELMGQQLQRAQERPKQRKKTKKVKSKKKSSTYWTAERLDEEGIRLGKVADYYKINNQGVFNIDPNEILAIDGSLRTYSIITSLLIAIAFAKSTTAFIVVSLLGVGDSNSLQQTLQLPAIAILLANFGSAAYNAFIQAPEKERNSFVWAVKGFAGGPVAVTQLRNLKSLKEEQEKKEMS